MSRFPAAFRPPAFASRSSDSRRGVGPSSRSAYRARGPDPDGVTTFRTHELRPGWVPPLPRGRRCSSRPRRVPRPAPAASQRPVPAPRYLHPIRGALFTRHQRGSRNSPVRPSPRLWPPGWNGQPLGFPPSFAPRRPGAGRRTSGWGQAMSTGLELRSTRHQSTSNPRSSLVACDLASQLRWRTRSFSGRWSRS